MSSSVADLCASAFGESLAPEPLLTVSAWADQYRLLSSTASAEPGHWRTDRTPYLREVMDCLSPSHPAERVVVMKGAQIGGPLDVDTRIPTPQGWTTMRALAVGDMVFDENGRPVTVTGVSETFVGRRCLRFNFSDHTEVVCDERHLWTVEDAFPGHRGKRDGCHVRSRTITAGEIEKTLLHNRRHRYAIPIAGQLRLEDEALPADPYAFGVWLGDGHHRVNTFTIFEDDAELVAAEIERGGHSTRITEAPNSGRAKLVTIDPRGAAANRPSFMETMRVLGVCGNKSIPALYLRGSETQRWRLLRGLMDTDGSVTVDGKRCEFSTISPGLCRDVVELLRSLGLKPSVYRGCPGSGYGGTREHLRISFTAYHDHPVFGLPRKQGRLQPRPVRRGETLRRRIVAVDEAPSRPVCCISVANPSGLFLAGDGFIPTHNTECGNNWIGYVIHRAPGPMLMVQPTVETAKRVSKQRLAPMIDSTPVLRARVAEARARDSGNTVQVKEFEGGLLIITGANSAAGLRSMPIRFLFMDEVDEYPGDVDGQGDPVALAEKRTTTFSRRKVFLVSTPTIKGLSRIEREFLASDQRRYFLACPNCGCSDYLTWRDAAHHRLEWDEGRPETAHMVCRGCGARVEERHKTGMLMRGEWRSTAEGDSKTVGFHLSALYSPLGWKSWAECVAEFLTVKEDPFRLKTWVNTVLGETWEERGDSVTTGSLLGRLEPFPAEAPDGIGVLVAAVDVQGDRLEVKVKGFGVGEESWLVAYSQIHGDPARDPVWHDLDVFLAQTFDHESGQKLRVECTVVDSGGLHTEQVYRYCKARQGRRVFAIKGGSLAGRPLVQRPSVHNRYRVKLFVLCVDTGKDIVLSRLQIQAPKVPGTPVPGFIHLPSWVDEEYLAQLTSEKAIRKYVKGRGAVREWVKLRERNEALDLEVYALAALYILGQPLIAALPGRAAGFSRRVEPGAPQPAAAAPVPRRARRPGGWASRW